MKVSTNYVISQAKNVTSIDEVENIVYGKKDIQGISNRMVAMQLFIDSRQDLSKNSTLTALKNLINQ